MGEVAIQLRMCVVVVTATALACSGPKGADMKANGGAVYAQRQVVLAAGQTEQCLLCHGPGRTAAIATEHVR